MIVPNVPQPPILARSWTALTGPETRVLGVRNDLIAYRSAASVGVIRSEDGSTLWRMENIDRYQGPEALSGDSIFAVRDTNEKKTLIKLGLKDGRPGLKVSLPGHARDMAVSPGYVFILFSSGEIRAYSDSTLTPLWKAPVLASANIPRLIAVGGRLVASIESRVYCFEMSSGKPLWTYDEPYHSTPYASVTGERFLLRRSVIDLATGSRLWQLPHYPNWMALAGTSVISEEGDRLVVRDLEHGGARLNNPGGNLIGAGQYPGPQWENGQFLLTQNKMYRPSTFGNDLREHVRAIDSEGKIVWEIPGALPVTVDPWLNVGYDGLRRYVPGRIAGNSNGAEHEESLGERTRVALLGAGRGRTVSARRACS